MAFTASAILEVESGASDTTGVGVFDPGVAGMDASGSVASANTSAPVVTVNGEAAGDVNMWFYLKSATNSVPGWYPITAVDTSAHTYTLNAAIGAAVLANGSLNTAVGCATASTLSSVTWAVDFSQTTGNIATGTVTTAAAVATATTAIFRKPMVGNGITNGSAWRVIIGYTSTTIVTLDASPTWTAQSVSLGGALASYGKAAGLHTAGNGIFIKNGTFTEGATTTSLTNGSFVLGYNAIRGDNPTGSSRPLINATAGSITLITSGANIRCFAGYIQVGGNSQTSVTGFNIAGSRGRTLYCKALSCATGFTSNNVTLCEANTCTTGFSVANAFGCVSISSTTGFSSTNNRFCIASGGTTGYTLGTGALSNNCIAYNMTNGFSAVDDVEFENCIASTCTTGYSLAAANASNLLVNCAGWNNNTNVTTLTTFGQNLSFQSLASDPFTNAAGLDFRLTAAAIALVGNQGLPGTMPGAPLSVGYNCIGALVPKFYYGPLIGNEELIAV